VLRESLERLISGPVADRQIGELSVVSAKRAFLAGALAKGLGDAARGTFAAVDIPHREKL